MDGSPLTRKVVHGLQTAIQRQGRPTAGDTTCSVKGVLVVSLLAAEVLRIQELSSLETLPTGTLPTKTFSLLLHLILTLDDGSQKGLSSS